MTSVNSENLLIVDRCEMAPGHCMATLTSEDPKGFVDTLLSPSVFDSRVCVSVSWIEETARKLGMKHADDDADLRAEVEDLRQQLLERDEQLRAVEVLESADFVAKKKAAAKRAAKKKTTKKAE